MKDEKCRTYDCADAANTQKKVGDYQKEYDEKTRINLPSNHQGKRKITMPLDKKNKRK